MGYILQYTVRCRSNAVDFLQNPHNRHPIARPWGRGTGCLFWELTHSVSASVVVYVVSYGIGPRYNGTWLCWHIRIRSHRIHSIRRQTVYSSGDGHAELVMGNDQGFRGIACWPWQEESCVIGKEAHWSLRGLIVKSAEHCGADYKVLDK